MTKNTCLICGHLDGDHGDGYCTKASGGPCICIKYIPPLQAPSSTDPQETTMTDHTTEAERFHNEYLRIRTPGQLPTTADVLALANYHATMAMHDAIRATAPNTAQDAPRCTWTAHVAGLGAPRCIQHADHFGTSHLLANGQRIGGASAPQQDASGGDLSAQQPEPAQEPPMKWQTGYDSYHRIGDTWVLNSAVQAVEKSALSDGWSRVHLASGAEVKVKGTPEEVIHAITRREQPK